MPGRRSLSSAMAGWLSVVVAAYGLRLLTPGTLGPLPVNLVPFTLLLAVLFGAWVLIPRAREVLLSISMPALVAVHAGRVAGVFFWLLYLDGRLSAPFAPVAAIGDIITGAVALLLLAVVAVGGKVPKLWLGAWNAFGLLDLLTALMLATLSVPGTAFRVFTEGPGTLVMGTLPWIFVPAMLVPLDLLVHVVIIAKLRSSASIVGRMAIGGAR